MRSCAVFDLDGTIIDNSSERVFLKYLLERGELPFRNLSQWLLDFIRTRDLRQAKANKVYLKGLDYQHICDLAQICFTERLVERISPKVFDLIESHRAQGRAIVILSGSLELLVRFFYEHLKADLMVGYALEVVGGAITGRGVGLNPYGENKAQLVQGLAETHNFDLSESYAYGNHHSDAHKLKRVGHPVAVNPDRKLREIAIANDWQIEQFHTD
jgi:HAD superfamily hydrolase (TIGR01490 family)